MNFSVVVPVGPRASDQKYLDECLDSIEKQTLQPHEVIIIDDMANVPTEPIAQRFDVVQIYKTPWRVGVAHAFNFGVGLAANDFVFLMGADDVLNPTACEHAMTTAERIGYKDAYYWMPVAYSDGREQYQACGAALVTKGLWRMTGGFPPETASGAPDAAFISILLVHHPELIIQATEELSYGYRVHNECDTAMRGPWQGVILQTRDILTRDWTQPEWGRM